MNNEVVVSITSVFLSGILSFFSLCILPLLPVYIGLILKFSNQDISMKYGYKRKSFSFNWEKLVHALVFIGGLSTTFVILGFGAGAFETVLNSKEFLYICAIIVIIIGVHQTGVFSLLFLNSKKKLNLPQQNKNSFLISYVLGGAFSFGWVPCIDPILSSILFISSDSNQTFYGVAWLLLYVIGFSVPFICITLFTDYLLNILKKARRNVFHIRVIGGVLIAIMGIMLLTGNLNILSILFAKI